MPQRNTAQESSIGAQQPALYLPKGPLLPSAAHPLTAVQPAVDANAHEHFVWTLAHELRQPLAVLSAAVALVRNDAPSDTTIRAVDVMSRQIAQMSRMIEDLLDAARLVNGKVSIQFERVDLRAVAADASMDVEAEMTAHCHTFDVDCASAPLFVRGDAQRLHQVFSNLLRNAVKYTDPGGRIVFTVEGSPDTVTARVLDTGRGIGAPGLTRIFDLFTQIEPSATGLGIGLSVVREIIALHSGMIQAHSAGLGKGSEFVVVLPRIE